MLGIGINERWGTWHAYRAVVLADTACAVSGSLRGGSPCASCAERLCIEACPAGATRASGFAVGQCVVYRKRDGSACRASCLARPCCPVAKHRRYSDAQVQYRNARSLQTIGAESPHGADSPVPSSAVPAGTGKALFACFARGGPAAILTRLHPDIEWGYGVISNDVPWYRTRRGRADVAEFFETLGALTWHQFQPKTFLAHDDLVVVLLDADYTVTASGQRVVYEDAVMLWRFDAAGQVVRFAHRIDTHLAWRAWRAS